MPRLPIVVVADDLTGAAEIAAIGHRHGLSASVVSASTVGGVPSPRVTVAQPETIARLSRAFSSHADLLVIDTDTRLDAPEIAAAKLAALGHALADFPRAWLYKKTDSVLRGPVRAELEALAVALNFSRVVLVPANPALGRTVQRGHYAINGVPLHKTAFSHDPHHPALSSDVCDLLGKEGSMAVSAHDGHAPFLSTGIVVGDAISWDDLVGWTRRTTSEVLPAGGAGFFSAWLRERGFSEQSSATVTAVESPVLIISGTTSPSGADFRQRARQVGIAVIPVPVEALRDESASNGFKDWAQVVRSQLSATGRALVFYDGPISSDEQIADGLRRVFARLAREIVEDHAVRHLIVEGGATAAAITRALSWDQLKMVREWAPGVASLQPVGDFPLTLTLKPGSYAWPTALWQNVLHSDTKSLPA